MKTTLMKATLLTISILLPLCTVFGCDGARSQELENRASEHAQQLTEELQYIELVDMSHFLNTNAIFRGGMFGFSGSVDTVPTVMFCWKPYGENIITTICFDKVTFVEDTEFFVNATVSSRYLLGQAYTGVSPTTGRYFGGRNFTGLKAAMQDARHPQMLSEIIGKVEIHGELARINKIVTVY